MRITCLHGYFIVREDQIGEIAKFNSRYGLDLVAKDDYFTFALLADAPIYSVTPSPYLGTPTSVTFCGNPWEVMRENGLIYNYILKIMQPILTVTTIADFQRLYANYVSTGLIMPGSLTSDWLKITGYTGGFDWGTLNFYYSELFYD